MDGPDDVQTALAYEPLLSKDVTLTMFYQVIAKEPSFPADTVQKLKAAATVIKARLRSSSYSQIQAGVEIAAVRSLLPHGLFQPWVKLELQKSVRTAERLMALKALAPRIDTLSTLMVTTLYALTEKKVVAAERDALLDRLIAENQLTDANVLAGLERDIEIADVSWDQDRVTMTLFDILLKAALRRSQKFADLLWTVDPVELFARVTKSLGVQTATAEPDEPDGQNV